MIMFSLIFRVGGGDLAHGPDLGRGQADSERGKHPGPGGLEEELRALVRGQRQEQGRIALLAIKG